MDNIKRQLNELMGSGGWKLIEDKLKFRLEEIEDEILGEADKEKNKIVFTEYDLLRAKRNLIKSFIEAPIDMSKY